MVTNSARTTQGKSGLPTWRFVLTSNIGIVALIPLTVDGVGVKAAAVQADIGAVDGMVHIIDRLLGMPYQTVYLKLASDPDLKVTYELAEQDDWGSVLNGNEKRFTFFVPGNEAWAQLRNEMPTEFKQLTMGAFPYHVHKILDRHLVVNRELRSTDLERLKEIQMVHGNYKVIHGGYPNGKRNISGGLPPLGEYPKFYGNGFIKVKHFVELCGFRESEKVEDYCFGQKLYIKFRVEFGELIKLLSKFLKLSVKGFLSPIEESEMRFETRYSPSTHHRFRN
ncbi:fasciclin-1 [Trichonephila clavipes]|uniref:Fasciclin-1 n=1 Tax=Trichonephila clavipes TaxID=2585209 RepID=A0A8X6VYQ2_TRICX|nr:fasciclin-1 [Trichonephila clavipes]